MEPMQNMIQDPCPIEDSGGESKELVILKHSDLVKHMALRLFSRLPDHVSIDDLISAGVIGLIDAVDKYDSSQGIPFKFYAKIRIRGAMLDEIRAMDWVPRSLRQKGNVLERTFSALEQKLGHCPSDDQVAGEMQIGMEEYYRLLDEIKGTGGKVLKTSLSHEDEAKLQTALSAAKERGVKLGSARDGHWEGREDRRREPLGHGGFAPRLRRRVAGRDVAPRELAVDPRRVVQVTSASREIGVLWPRALCGRRQL